MTARTGSRSDEGLDYLGCRWHPSLHDHRIVADRLLDYVATLPLWGGAPGQG